MKGEYRLKILEFIEASAQTIDDLLFIFSLPYGTSFSRMEYLLSKRQGKRGSYTLKEADKKLRRRFSDFFYRLKKDNLIAEIEGNKKHIFKLTEKGKKFLQKFRYRPLTFYGDKIEKDDLLKIIIFDIPESEKRKREWLRTVLKNLGFYMLQKSVWAGKIKLPKEFINDLARLNLLSFIEIFVVAKTGSIRQPQRLNK